MVSGWHPAGAAEEGGGGAAAADVVGAGAVVDGACAVGAGAAAVVAGTGDVAGAAGCVFSGGACRAVAVAFGAVAVAVAWWLGDPVAVAEAVPVKPAFVPLPGDEGDRPAFAAPMMSTRAAKARHPVSTLWRAGQDLPRGGCGR